MSQRRNVVVAAKLLGTGAGTPVLCAADNISEGGIHVQVSQRFAVALGERIEVVLDPGPDAPHLAHLRGEIRFATVVRTEPQRDTLPPGVGLGLRFDQPLYL
ncbi:MAG TPA: PilZ domain-containing protein [Phycisphaerae bacterium]|nr:PilZ domain-containing protein [Phycisphaerae bacterium]HNU46335.1 PilZ domain-containing protein [Phycisphaerae bacterium]